jgi:hypothetical protein
MLRRILFPNKITANAYYKENKGEAVDRIDSWLPRSLKRKRKTFKVFCNNKEKKLVLTNTTFFSFVHFTLIIILIAINL